jgi:transcriptional regulator with XRE-family HTH domain
MRAFARTLGVSHSTLSRFFAGRRRLSARAIRRIGALVGASILERLAARNDLSDTTRIYLNRELRARLAEDTVEQGAPSAADAVADAQKEGRLDGEFVEKAAQSGQRELVVLALAQLANVNEQTVKKVLTAGGAKPLVALVWHAHLSMRVAFKIQTFIMKLPTRDVLPARGGVGFPLSKEEMRWHLNYFGITA